MISIQIVYKYKKRLLNNKRTLKNIPIIGDDTGF